jgi:hypothetical protein
MPFLSVRLVESILQATKEFCLFLRRGLTLQLRLVSATLKLEIFLPQLLNAKIVGVNLSWPLLFTMLCCFSLWG